MASSGGDGRRHTYSEPRNRSQMFARLINQDDGRGASAATASSGRHEDRLNNWDFSDWQPSSSYDTAKRPKRGNEEKEEMRRSGKGNNAAMDASPMAEGRRHRTPSTFPRTRVTSSTTQREQRTLENLRQALTFSDTEEISTDGMDRESERNNERYMPPRRDRPVQMSLERNEVGSFGRRTEPSRDNRNAPSNLLLAESDDNPDSTQIVGRLMQIRDYIKQSSSMLDKLHSSANTDNEQKAGQLEQVISRLKEQEQKYLELLLRLSTAKEEELLRRQNTEGAGESESEAATELDVGASDSSDNEQDEPVAKGGTRPRIEDHLGRHSDTENEDLTPRGGGGAAAAIDLESTLVAEPSPEQAAQRLLLQSDLESKSAELEALKQQHELLSKMLQQQQQLRTLQTRQTQLMTLQREAEQRLEEERERADHEDAASSTSSVTNNLDVPPSTEGAEAASPIDPDILPQELRELRQRLDYLKNIYDIDDDQEKANEEQTSVNTASDSGTNTPIRLLSMDKTQLESRLGDLQEKKQAMDRLLVELQGLTGAVSENVETASNTSSQARMGASIEASAVANRTEEDAQDLLRMLEARKKMQKLQEVRDRLDQLKSLVQYYQSGAEFIHGDTDEAPAPPTSALAMEPLSLSDAPTGPSDAAFLQSLRRDAQSSVRELLSGALSKEGISTEALQAMAASRGELEGRSDTASDSASQLSSALGAWGEDPQIQEKVRRLKEAKEKLHRLQDLVAMVQESPEAAQHLPDDLDALAAAMQAPANPLAQGDGLSLREAVSLDSDAAYEQAEAYYEARMGAQRGEIDRLMAERQKLMSLQQELQRLHDHMPASELGQREMAQQTSPHVRVPTADIAVETTLNNQDYRMPPSPNNRQLAAAAAASEQLIQHSPNNRELAGETSPRRQSGAQQQAQAKGPEAFGVTFQEPLETVISNEELYGRMRQQRMLREELREKKKELEDMMRKDKPKKQNFSRHQDNQSDNVSFSNRSDPFTDRASQDQTAATWGGSTADNLESIEEDAGDSGDGQQADEECDDGYPSDGIVQVEEEEEANENDSDDRDTYTIENDQYPSSKMRARGRDVVPPIVSSSGSRRRAGAHRERAAARDGAPFQVTDGASGVGYNYWAPDNNQVLNNVRSTRSRTRTKRRNKEEINALKEEMEMMREQLGVLQETLQNFSHTNHGIPSEPSPFSNNMQYMASLQQQQMFLSLSQLQNQLGQQQDTTERLARLERAVTDSTYGSTDVLDVRNRIVPGPASQYQNPSRQNLHKMNNAPPTQLPTMPHYLDNYSSLNRNDAAADSGTAQFDFDPTFPRGFAALQPDSLDTNQASFTARNLSRSHRRNVNNNQNNAEAMQGQSMSENPFRIPDYLLRGSSLADPRYPRVESDADDVAIETIGAVDVDESREATVPRLNFTINSRTGQRSEQTSQQYQGARPKQRGKPPGGESSRKKQQEEAAVIGQRFPSAGRAGAAAKLASQRVRPSADYRPGLSAGISGTAYEDTRSVSSALSSCPGTEEPLPTQQQNLALAAEASHRDVEEGGTGVSSEFSLFEALRETIYSEVATLISQNESRPHYLIEMFREVQMLNTDYLRQRFLYCIKDLVNKYLTEESLRDEREARARVQARRDMTKWSSAPGGRISEMTPSDSFSTLDEEEVKAKIFGKTSKANMGEAARQPDNASGVRNNHPSTRYDFSEQVETLSSVSTPDSNNFESPFAQDSLGDTVIHLDKLYDSTFEEYCSKLETLQRMKEYEERLATSGTQTTPGSSGAQAYARSPNPRSSLGEAQGAVAHPRTSSRDTSQLGGAEADSSSAMDNGSEGSLSDIGESTSTSSSSEKTYPRIDTQQLDAQIKSIMTEIIPVLKEHMDDVCSQQLLLYIRRLVLSLTKQRDDEGQEFVRFFHKQLGSILQDSLAKFEGRKMRDCGEDLLVDLSEILFNELAFFRLMQDLDDPKARVKANLRNWHQSGASNQPAMEGERASGQRAALSSQSDEEDSEESDSSDTLESEDAGEGSQVEKQDVERSAEVEGQNDDLEEAELESLNHEEEEQLGKDRDDEMAAQMTIAADDAKSSMKITLAPSETKPMTRIGSDEDTEGDDAEYSNEDPSDTAVSHDYYHYNDDMRDPQARDTGDEQEEQVQLNGEPEETVKAPEEVIDEEATGSQEDAAACNGATQKELESQDNEKDADTQEHSSSATSDSAPQVNGQNSADSGRLATQYFSMYSVPSSDDDPDCQVVENGHMEEGAEGELTIADLPDKLSGLSQLSSKAVAVEDVEVSLGAADVLEYVNAATPHELAGDPNAIKEPEPNTESSDSSRQV